MAQRLLSDEWLSSRPSPFDGRQLAQAYHPYPERSPNAHSDGISRIRSEWFGVLILVHYQSQSSNALESLPYIAKGERQRDVEKGALANIALLGLVLGGTNDGEECLVQSAKSETRLERRMAILNCFDRG